MLLEKWLLTVQRSTTVNEATLYMFGNNTGGQLGNNSTTFLSSPVLIGTSSWSQVAVGNSHTIALRSDKTMWAWGNNSVGQLGNADRSLVNRSNPVQVGTSSWTSISTNADTNYAIRSDGSLFAWGLNIAGQMGNNQAVSTWTRYSWTTVGAGQNNAWAIQNDGSLWGWGFGSAGLIGDNTVITRSSPVQIGTNSWTMISGTPIALRSDSTLWAWGLNTGGQLGIGTTTSRSSPVQIGTSSWTLVSGEGLTGSAIRTDGALFIWGTNGTGQLGDSTTIFKSSPIQVGTSSWSQVSAASSFALAIRTDGALFAWGLGTSYQLGTLSTISRSSPVQVSITNNPQFENLSWSQVRASAGNAGISFAIDYNSTLWGWGVGTNGVMGQGTVSITFAPLIISSLYTYDNEVAYSASTGKARLSWTSIGVGASHSVGIKDNKLYTWGNNVGGQLGDNTVLQRSSPVQVGTSSWSQVTAGATFTAAIRSDGGLFTWGINDSAQLGSGTTLNRSSPVQVGTDSWSMISTTNTLATSVIALRSDKTLWMWGGNNSGSLGINAAGNRSSPVQVSTSSWTTVSGGYLNNGAIRIDGALFMWGTAPWNADGTTLNRSSPVQVGTSSWTLLSVGNQAAAAIRSDGTLWTWGTNTLGQMGNYTTITTSSPVQISSLSTPEIQASYLTAISKSGYSWTQVASGGVANQGISYAIRSDGALFGWGSNAGGQLGLGDTIQRFIPVQIGTSSWTQVSVGMSATVAIRSGGSLFAWGLNTAGQLGDGTTINRSSPVQIGTSSWTAICASASNTLGGWTLAIRSGGSLFAWGNNAFGVLGLNDVGIHRSSPVQIGTSSWTSLGSTGSGGVSSSMALRSDRGLFAWGYNFQGQLGLPDRLHRSSPTQVGTSSWTTMTAGSDSPGAIRIDGALFSWGVNGLAAVGDGTTINRSSPVQIGTSDSWSMVSSFTTNTGKHAITTTGALYAWGTATNWTIGNGVTTGAYSTLQLVTAGPTSRSWNNIASGGNGALGIDNQGQLWTWGISSYGENGQFGGGIFPVSLPKFLPSVNDSWTFVDAGVATTTSAVRSDGAMFAWGNNSAGQLGIGSVGGHRSFPIQIGTSNSWSQVTIGSHAMAVTSNGQGRGLFTWGLAGSGQLGDLWVAGASSPVFIRSINDSWTTIATNSTPSVVGVRIDGTLWTWGNNASGQLGLNDRNHRSRPTQVGLSNIWSNAYSAGSAQYALDNTGLIWSWGDSGNGILGITNNPSSVTGTWLINRSSPVQVGSTVFSASPTQIGTSSWTSVSAGTSHALAIRSGGSLFAWGSNANQQIGDNTSATKSSPVQLGTSSWNVVSAGNVHSLAIANDNSLWGWGLRYQLSDYSFLNNPTNFLLTSTNLSWTQVAFNQSNTVALRSDGAMFTWGQASNYALLLPVGQGPLSPTQVGTSSWSAVAASFSGGTAIRSDGALFIWGNNSFGQLGINDQVHRSSPVQIGTSSWTQVAMAISNTVALRSDRALFTWGSNSNGLLGDGTTINRSSPVQIGTSSWTTLAAKGGTVISGAIRIDGSLYIWGQGGSGQIGDATAISKSSPVQIGTSSWSMVSLSISGTSSAIRSDGALFAWGSNGVGQIGDGTTTSKSSPVLIGTSSWTYVSAGYGELIGAVRSDGSLFTWGNGLSGTGGNSNANRSSPVQVGTSSWTQVLASFSTTMAIDSNYALWGWGQVTGGGGLGAYYASLVTNRSSPVQLPSYLPSPGKLSTLAWNKVSAGYSHSVGVLTDGKLYGFGNIAAGNFTPYSWAQISAGFNAYGAIRSDGALFMWGSNTQGQLGLNNAIASSLLLQVGTSSWSQISAGGQTTGAIRSDGALFAWGQNSQGQVGDGTSTARSSPVQIGTDSWTSVVASTNNPTMAIRNDGGLFVWGSNANGELGLNDATSRASPTQLGTDSWSMVTSTGYSLAIRSDGALFAWGQAANGRLGDGGLPTNRSSPIQIGTSSWSMVSTKVGSMALRSDYSLWTWGGNTSGQLGDGTTVDKSSPVQITSLGVNEVSNSYYFATTGQTQYNWISQNEETYIRSDNTLWTYGTASGNGTTSNLLSLVQIGTSSWTFAGKLSAIRSDGALFMWNPTGGAQYGTNGDGTTIGRSSPVQVSTVGASWTTVASATSVAMAIRTDGAIFTWGRNNNGQLGDGTTINRSDPVQIGTSSWTQIAMNTTSGSAIRLDGAVFAWGRGSEGQIGDGTTINRSSPVQVGTSSWTAIASTGTQSTFLAIRTDGALFTWGYNFFGQIGDGTTINRSSPVQVGTSSWTAIASSNNTFFAIRKDGALFGWGSNLGGQLGLDSDTTNRSSPVQIGTSSWTSLGGGGFFGKLTTGGAYGWDTVPRPAFTVSASRIAFITANTDESWTTIGAGGSAQGFSLGLRKDSMLFTWGDNAYGQLGDGTVILRSRPVQIGPSQSTPWVLNSNRSISTGASNAFVINSFPGRSIFAWGGNGNFALAQNEITGGSDANHRSSPVQIGTYANLVPPVFINSPTQIGTSSWSQVSAEFNNTLAINSSGAVFEWGYNVNRPVAGITSVGVSANTVSSNQISAGSNAFGVIKPPA